MPVYKAPVSDTLFLLNDVFDFQRYSNLPRFSEAPIDVVEAVLSEGGKFAEEVLQPLNLTGDRRAAGACPTVRSSRLKGSRKPTRPLSRAVGSGFRPRRNTADRACRISSASP